MSSSRAEPTMAELLESGRRFVAAKKYKLALEPYRLAMTKCPCTDNPNTRKYVRTRCSCKNFKKVVAVGGSIIREAMKTCHCKVRIHFQDSKCDSVHHIEALDGRAAAFEAMGKLDRATYDAEWILDLAPQLPDGYLRLGSIAQLQKDDDFAWEIYTMGIEAVKETGIDSSPKLQQLYDARESVNRSVVRKDPLCLPAEIVTQIFWHLRCDDLSLCLRVSKKWMRTLTSPPNARFWRDMQFSDRRRKRSPGLEELRRMLSWAGDGGARKVVIPGLMNLTQPMLMLLLYQSPDLEYLKIGYLSDEILFPSDGESWDRLRYFSLEGGEFGSVYERPVDDLGGFPYSFLQDAAASLEHLDFVGIPDEWYESEEPFIPFLPKLKTLRMNEVQFYGMKESHSEGFPFPIYPLSVAFPRLEQLYLGPDIPYFDPEPVSIWQDERDDIWPHLKVLIVEVVNFEEPSSDTERTRSALRCLTCINRGNSLQHIALEFHRGWPDADIFSGSDDLFPDFDIVEDSEFKNLRSFRSTSLSISPEGAQNLLSRALQTNQLTSFDIVFPKYYERGSRSFSSVDEYVGGRHADHLRGYDWARGAPSVQSMGCYGLDLDRPLNKLYDQEDHFLARFLATFPNLRTLSIDCKFKDKADYANLLVEILRLTHLETMYMRLNDLKACAQLRQAARDQGVQLMKLPNRFDSQRPTPREWPVSLGE